MRLLKATQIPQYSPEAIALIRSSLQTRLPPLESPTEGEAPDLGSGRPEGEPHKLIEYACKVFGRMLNRRRQHEQLSLRAVATDSGIDYPSLWRFEHGLCKPPQGSVLLRLINALQIEIDSPDAVEFVAAAGLPHLDDALLAEMAERLGNNHPTR